MIKDWIRARSWPRRRTGENVRAKQTIIISCIQVRTSIGLRIIPMLILHGPWNRVSPHKPVSRLGKFPVETCQVSAMNKRLYESFPRQTATWFRHGPMEMSGCFSLEKLGRLVTVLIKNHFFIWPFSANNDSPKGTGRKA